MADLEMEWPLLKRRVAKRSWLNKPDKVDGLVPTCSA